MRRNSNNLRDLMVCCYFVSVIILIVVPSPVSPNNDTDTAHLKFRTNYRRRQITLIPEPVGPYYGFLYNTKTASRLPIQGSATGSCQKGKSYRIRRIDDLRRYESELQCIFAAGLTPSKVPEGPHFGKVLLTLNSRHFLINPLANYLWGGNAVFKAECHNTDKTPTYIGVHNVRGRSLVPCILTVDKLKANLAPGEYEDGRKSVVMDFTQDFTKACPDYADFVERNKSTLPTRVKTLANVYPFNQVFDVFRLVGRLDDGGALYLGKTYLRDYFRKDKQVATIAFFYIVTYDDEVNPEFEAGSPLPPLEEGFKYTFPGVIDIIFRYLPIDNAISRPFRTLWNFKREEWRTGRASFLNFREFFRNLGSLRLNARRFNAYFESRKPKSLKL